MCQGAFKCEDGFTFFQSETAILDFYIFRSVHYDTIVTSTNKIHTLRYNHNSVLIYAYSYTIIDKTLTYASETWTLTKRDRKQLNIFESKVYRRISNPVYDNEKENWRKLTNKEIHAKVKKPTIIETIRLNRLRWFGHLQRMEENRIPKRVLYMNLGTTRLRDIP